MARITYLVMIGCLLALSACGGSGPSGEVITKGDDVLGVWRRTERWAHRGSGLDIRNMHVNLEADGTMAFGMSPDKWEYELCSEEFAFEGTQFKVTETTCPGLMGSSSGDESCAGQGTLSGVYEVQLLANGNLKFIDAGDTCQNRRQILTLAEWEPVQ